MNFLLRSFILVLLLGICERVPAQSLPAAQLYSELRQHFMQVKDYKANVRVIVDVNFLKMPPMQGILYYKAPDKLLMDRKHGVSLMPRRTVDISVASLFASKDVEVLDGGYELVGTARTRVLRLVPLNPGSDVVLAKVWVDEAQRLVLRAETTTRDNGTIQAWLTYGKYAAQALPDRIVFQMDVEDFKMPKGITMDYEGGSAPPEKSSDGKRKKGKIEIRYLSYQVNIGLSDAIFESRKK